MSLSKRGIPCDDTKLNTTSNKASLNPNAAEFVPKKVSSGTGTIGTAPIPNAFETSKKAAIDRSESSITSNSDEEAHQYWHHQLPDDITPDFKVMEDDESLGLGSLSLSGLSLIDAGETSKFSFSMGSRYLRAEPEELSPSQINGNTFAEKLRYSVPSYGGDSLSVNYLHSPSKLWEKDIFSSDQLLSRNRDAQPYSENTRQDFMNEMMSERGIADDSNAKPLEFLASQFPGFAAESLAEVYYTNKCDLNLTIGMLTQLELQVDGSVNQNLSSKTLSAPNLSNMDFPALPLSDNQNGLPKYSRDDLRQNFSPYQSSGKDSMLLFNMDSSMPSRSATDFASIVKRAPQNSGMWKDDRNRSPHTSIGSSRNPNLLASSYNTANGRGTYSGKLQSRNSTRTAPAWLETGDAVANLYSEMREEARDYARLRNVYFEQAREAYLVGNKALAKELSMKGQLYNMQMKAAHGKAQESIYRQRNTVGLDAQGNGRGQDKLIDLHGLHVSEAIHLLKHELRALRSMARSAEQRLRVYVCVGTGHHTRGSRTPARLPAAVQQYLLEEEGLDYTEPQPGLLQLVIY